MSKKNLTDAQKAYRRFDKARIIICYVLMAFFLVALIFFLIGMRNLETNAVLFLIASSLLILWVIIVCIVAPKLNAKGLTLYEAAYGKDDEAIRTGLFDEIWKEFEWNRFEGMTAGKVVFAEAHNNTIEMEIRNRHNEFDITIDKDAIYMVMDDETDAPVEKEVSLSDVQNIQQFYIIVREFVERK